MAAAPFDVAVHGTFAEPWALAVEPGAGRIVITERGGTAKIYQPATGALGTITGLPAVAHGGQGGLGDFVFAPDYPASRMVYLSWAEPGEDNTRGAAVGRARLDCGSGGADCALSGLTVIWRQSPKVTGRGHYSHRIAFSPDGQYLFVSSGDRQKMQPAQDLAANLGKVVRLLPDGTAAPGNPFAAQGGVAAQVWSYGHRNVLGLAFDPQGRLWDLEHGPAGGDELNRVEPGRNYGWPLVSQGDHYNGTPIPRHATRPDLAAPALSWNPVIAPGGMIVYTGTAFPAWQGQVLIAGLDSGGQGSGGLVRVGIDGETARELARYPLDNRIRAIAQGPDSAIWVAEDGPDGRLLQLTARR